ncbi:hypothetical protein A2631_04845 [Candidatus Daviesbacteria bacterium RIFCSPHIGHO2_01_FULL_44_29]|uniref:FCP1 homology domain-containing protein n=1 Tax=Candidatus Daviesbacteria bacterium RIFCSPHIGHO2_02_FULL_43_12 TaxID=1797776 RepID=A0A1F5KGR9_9BACT|nr:MAG: hypothetical protein A2631_04845 [Candidatus Daviesbacteria bacterium RIFCSPHIGHO2_01_FULL_44_29]OGE40049.1 MAG: hypothetical protein A3D25_04575 [Candidatus Daviesbacteria bacterium RIFCSPHIGHO2_02_FULL_43_12]OGE41469.1 MAG: hypothetical protein A3E86_05235 [Candidatus Daviesbacteria bacterium RIFCSPHIGHO2_12_FULL_47_45]OGE70271.1 MAG: hypothetical protein A3B55_00995 [Candidatus Daviesbacteria bacterium RIFCSPLOWO2_01_FULL_43_15]
MIKAIVFDIDGVLLPELFRFSNRYTKEHGLASDHLAYFFHSDFEQCILGRADLKEVLKNHLKKWGWDKSVDELLGYWFESDTTLDPKVMAVINDLKLKGVKIFVASNQEKYRGEYLTEVLGLGLAVDKVFISAHLGQKKPSPEFFNTIRQEIKLKPEEILFFDDGLENVQGAKNVGWKAHLYTDFKNFEKVVEKNIL